MASRHTYTVSYYNIFLALFLLMILPLWTITLSFTFKTDVMLFKMFRWIKSKFSSKKGKGEFGEDNPFLIL